MIIDSPLVWRCGAGIMYIYGIIYHFCFLFMLCILRPSFLIELPNRAVQNQQHMTFHALIETAPPSRFSLRLLLYVMKR